MTKKEQLTMDINELIFKISEYYGVVGNKQNAIFGYLKNCEKALIDLLNEFDKDGKKVNKLVPFDNIFNYKSDYKTLNKDFNELEEEYKRVCKEFEKKEEEIDDCWYEISRLKNIIEEMENKN